MADYAGWMEESGFQSACPIATTLLETAPRSSAISDAGEPGARGRLGEFNKRSLHDWLILAGQIFALLYGVAHLWIFLAY